MTLFDTYGHLTQQALDAWAEGSLCTAQRLLVAEHLSVCDECLLRMTMEEVEGPDVPQPKTDMVQSALRRLRQGKMLEILKRCGIVAAAACFCVLSWHFKLFSIPEEPTQPQPTQPSALYRMSAQLSDGLFDWSANFSMTLQNTFEREYPGDDTDLTTRRSNEHE